MSQKLNPVQAKYHIEDARLNWALGNQPLAKQLIKFVSDKKVATLSYLTSQRIHGEYLAETRSEETKKVISDYLQNSIKALDKMKTNVAQSKDTTEEGFKTFYAEHLVETYQLIAKYADREYQQIAEYKKSSAYEKKNSNIGNNKGRLAEMEKRSKAGQVVSKDEHSARFVLQGTIKIDENDIKATELDYNYYLKYAMKSYFKCIMLESPTNTSNRSHIFRVFSLWLNNKSNSIANATFEKYIENVASHKFVPLMPQITTHLSPNSDDFCKIIRRIVGKLMSAFTIQTEYFRDRIGGNRFLIQFAERCAIDHPYHTLHQIFALAYACYDNEDSNCAKSPRTVVAEAMIKKLEKQRDVCQIITQMREMYGTLIRLANKTMRPETKKLPKEEPLCKLKDLNSIHCPTVKLPISIGASYPSERLITIVKWSSSLMMPGGINAPKRIECVCSNGQTYLQLLKGRDDLRQDAVMQQVFDMMNDMLSHSKTTKKLRLNIRTYIVVPLSQRSGILEWCENTMPLSDYLVGSHRNKGAHERYFPSDDKPSQCREKLAQIGTRKKNCELSAEQVLAEFNQICAKINPVLHYFFYEKFYSPGVWYERRLAYAHSLATNSMIGYILGIGDRHISNILIDAKTAELIHIDFGIAFEQGKCLPTPETIPFRLTRDLVSALGSTGIEGVFRKSCEKTMEVLRTNKTTIVTIIEVLLHDPLYSWTLTNQKVKKRQHHRDNGVDEIQDINGMAERALLRLEEKLDGKHLSRSEANSIEGHVEILIQEATNMRNLSQLFVGWQAYL